MTKNKNYLQSQNATNIMTEIIPLTTRLLVKEIPLSHETTEAGLIIQSKDKHSAFYMAEVLKTGKDVTEVFEYDTILIRKGKGDKVYDDLIIVDQSNVEGVFIYEEQNQCIVYDVEFEEVNE